MDLSIIIVNHNTKALLRRLLASIYEHLRGIQTQVIVVDNNSSDGSAEMVKEEFPGTLLLENRTNAGFSAANNQGAKIARGRYLLFLNSDTKVCAGSLDAMVDFLDRDPTAGIVGGRLLNEDGSLQRGYGTFPTLKTEMFFRTFLNRILPANSLRFPSGMPSRDDTAPRIVDWVSGACLMIRRELFERVGGFDEDLYMYYEDVDLCLRVKSLGWKVVHTPESEVYHLHGSSWRGNEQIAIENSCRSSLLFFKKHKTPVETALLRGLILVQALLSYFVLLPYLLITGTPFHGIGTRLRGYTHCLKYAFLPLRARSAAVLPGFGMTGELEELSSDSDVRTKV